MSGQDILVYVFEKSLHFIKEIELTIKVPIYHLALELFLISLSIWLIFRKSYRLKENRIIVSNEVEEALINEWVPEPLVPDIDEEINCRTITDIQESHISFGNKMLKNLTSLDFHCFSKNPKLIECVKDAIANYGVGSCGPRGFYGTFDVHLNLENKIAEFLGVEEAIIYSYGFLASSTIIPAYVMRSDIVFCDEGVNYALKAGIKASRCKVYWFQHNNVESLIKCLETQSAKDKKNTKKAKKINRFLVVESLYLNCGDFCPIEKYIELKYVHKFRIILDESLTVGAIGEKGHGYCKSKNIKMNDIDFFIGSMEYGLASIGGFCAGSSYVVDHQRLSALGYCFSASQPPFTSIAAIKSLDLLENEPNHIENLRKNTQLFWSVIDKSSIPSGFEFKGDKRSHIVHLYHKDVSKLSKVIQKCEQRGIALSMATYILDDVNHVDSIRICINSYLSEEDILESVKSVIIAMSD